MLTRRPFLKSSLAMAAMTVCGTGMSGKVAAAVTGTGYRLPEEAEPHARTLMQWPVNRSVHPDPVFLEMLQSAIADIANAVQDFEPVVMLMDKKYEKRARRILGTAVELWPIPTDDLWCRDSGPVFVVDQQRGLAIRNFHFNGWGNKQTHGEDGMVAARVAARLALPLLDSGVVGEAGGVESDGAGTLMAHESSWVNANRNPEPRDVIEERLLAALGARKMIWAPGMKNADITDYHIDSLARFVRPGVVVIQLPDAPDPADPWSLAAFQTHNILKQATNAGGRALEIVTLPEPRRPRVTSPDFVASYVNYYVCNGAVIAAQFGDRETDGQAHATLKSLYPDRQIITLDVDPIGETGGGIHCATQQQPRI